jgi:hypothetical protein
MITPNLLTVAQFSEKHKAFPIGGMRYRIFNEHENGLAESGAIIRVGRKVLIDEAKFFEWVLSNRLKIAGTSFQRPAKCQTSPIKRTLSQLQKNNLTSDNNQVDEHE